MHRLSNRINSIYLLTITYHVVIFTILCTVMYLSGVILHRESTSVNAISSVGVGSMLGVLHRQVLYRKNFSTAMRLFFGMFILFVAALVLGIGVEIFRIVAQ